MLMDMSGKMWWSTGKMSSYLAGPISKLRLMIGQTVSQILFCMSENLLFGSMMNQPFMLMISDW